MQGEDRARLKGYLKKWSDSRIVIGCALYIEVLKPPSFLSLGLQGSNVDVVLAIKQILKTVSALKSLASQDPLQWPVVKQVIDRISADGDENTYQGTVILGYCDATLNECKQQALSDLKILSENMLKRLEWSDMKLLRALLQSSHISLIESETHSFQYDLTLTRFTTIFSLISNFYTFFSLKNYLLTFELLVYIYIIL